jgi:hypothetical protein
VQKLLEKQYEDKIGDETNNKKEHAKSKEINLREALAGQQSPSATGDELVEDALHH